jgi:hypothetical protein
VVIPAGNRDNVYLFNARKTTQSYRRYRRPFPKMARTEFQKSRKSKERINADLGNYGYGDYMPIERLTCYLCEEDNGGHCHLPINEKKIKELGWPTCCPYGLNVYADFTQEKGAL